MNWFERYGIPGAYFVGLTAGWVYAMYPGIIGIAHHQNIDFQGMAAIAAVVFLPIGYVISVASQTIYLNWRRCFSWLSERRCVKWLIEKSCLRWLLKLLTKLKIRNCMGYHTLALANIRDKQDWNNGNDEALIESYALLRSAVPKPFDVKTQEYVRNWIARRMDVTAINQSLIIATVLAGVIGCLCSFGQESSGKAVVILACVSFIVIMASVFSIYTIKRQVVCVIEEIFKKYGWYVDDQPYTYRGW